MAKVNVARFVAKVIVPQIFINNVIYIDNSHFIRFMRGTIALDLNLFFMHESFVFYKN